MKSINRLIEIGPHLILLEVMEEVFGRPLTEKEEARGMDRQMAAMMIMLLRLSAEEAEEVSQVLKAGLDHLSEGSLPHTLVQTWFVMLRNGQYARKSRASLDKP